MTDTFELHIDSLFRKRYLRNNKRGGLKHLRCFPECLSTGHHASGFCGHRVIVSTFSDVPLPANAIVVARFSFADDSLPTKGAVNLNQNGVVEKRKIFDQIRKRERPIADFVQATMVRAENTGANGRVKTVFHMEPPSWHYGWRSSKHTKDMKHRMYVYLLLPEGTENFMCVALDKSTEFKLSSSKRAKEGQEPKNQHLLITPEESSESIRQAAANSLKKRRRKRQKIAHPKIETPDRKHTKKEKTHDDQTQHMWTDIPVENDSEDEVDFMELEYPDTLPIDINPQTTARDAGRDYDHLKPLQVHQEDILLEFLGWPKSLQDVTQDEGTDVKLNDVGSDFIDPSLFFG